MFFRFHSANPEPKGELASLNPFTFLVAVVLSAQATDESVNRATGPLFAVADTPEKMLALGEERLSGYIKTIGLYRGKAKNVIALSRLLIERHGSAVPHDRAALEALPGVGRKTANVVRGHAFRLPGFPVDRHVLRVATRIGLLTGKAMEDAVAAETTLTSLLPPDRWTRASDTLILHGRRICKPKPLCERCTIRPHCAYYRLHGPGHVSR